jgi:TolB protein
MAVARPDGSDNHEIPPNAPGSLPPDEPSEPAWTPDGRRLAFNDQASTKAPQGIYSVNVNGSDRQLLVRDGGEPAFSPDGSKLAYVTASGIYTADADGSNPRPLTLSTKATTPTWSPNGRRIAFQRGDTIVVANADGSNERVIASVRGWPYVTAFVWSPDSKLIAFTRPSSTVGNRPFTSSIVVARADGGGERLVLRRRSTVRLQDPAWRPPTALPRANRLPCPS